MKQDWNWLPTKKKEIVLPLVKIKSHVWLRRNCKQIEICQTYWIGSIKKYFLHLH